MFCVMLQSELCNYSVGFVVLTEERLTVMYTLYMYIQCMYSTAVYTYIIYIYMYTHTHTHVCICTCTGNHCVHGPATSLQRTNLTYLLTPCTRVLLEKLTDSQLVKKFPEFYGTRKFITAFTRSRHLSLSCARSIQSIPPIPLPGYPS